ncbi:uncharacterized protein LOC129599687 isoform X2 [Paramacrobiotus metropolitanus]|uniref:uncharacterized protein LOC129599687 isoform X2 n=1 Tax=Paramacrobiotus metropolitanus TaxID=2943436 RepID=UPI00244615ED|nr:uncharacterized protein LOC129599687 isoform X2 [Paramacrobiotus metropolitanus]
MSKINFKMPVPPLHAKGSIICSRNSSGTKLVSQPTDAMQAAEIARQRIQARSLSMAVPAYRPSTSNLYTARAASPPRARERETYAAPVPPQLTSTVNQIWNAINLMLPKGSEDDVLRALMEQIAERLHVNLDLDLSGPQCSGSSSSDEIPLPHRLLVGNRTEVNGYYDHDQSPPRNRISDTLGAVGVQPRIRLLDSVPKPRAAVQTNHWRQPFRREPSEDSDYVPGRPHRFTAPKQRKRMQVNHRQSAARGITLAVPSQLHRAPPIRRRSVKQEGNLNEPIQLRDAENRISGYQCPRCPQSKKLRKDVVTHIPGHGAMGKFSCNECDFATDSKQIFNWHFKAHLKLSQEPTPERQWNGRPSLPTNRAAARNLSAADDIFSNPGSPAPAAAAASTGLACVISSCHFRGTDCKAIAEHMSREHHFYSDRTAVPKRIPLKSTRHLLGRARTTLGPEGLQTQEFQCPECPEAFAFKTHLVLHRRHRHPQPNRRGGRRPAAHRVDVDAAVAPAPTVGIVKKVVKRKLPKASSRRKRRAAARKAVQTRSAKTTPKRAGAEGGEVPEEGVEEAEDTTPSGPWQRASVIVSMPEYVENQVSAASSTSSLPNGNPVTVQQGTPKNRGGRKRKIPAEVEGDFPPPLDMAALEQNGNGWAGHERTSVAPVDVEYESAPGFEVPVTV